MPTFDTAHALLHPGETALCVLTDGRNLTINADGSGSTGFWKLTPTRPVDCVVVFRQEHRDGRIFVELFRAQHDGVVGPTEEGRFTVRLLGIESVGSTERGWQEFAGPGQNPVRYITRPPA